MAFLDYSGLKHYDQKMKQKVADEYVGKVAGKGLSTNDFTDELLKKVNEVEAGAQKNVQADWNETNEASDAFIKNKPTSLDGGDADTVNGHTVEADVPADAKFTDTTYGPATGDTAGLVRSGGDATLTDGVITVTNYTHNHDSQYAAQDHNHDDRYASTTHSHNFGDISGFDPTQFAPMSHTHSMGDVQDLQNALDSKLSNMVTINGHMLSQGEVILTANDVLAVPITSIGTASGVASLDETGKVPSAQLPSYVDDVVEGYYVEADGKFYQEAEHTTEIFPEDGKIYVDKETSKVYRWSGTMFVVISASLALGTTANTAFPGDKGQVAYEHSQVAHAPADAQKNVIEVIKVNGTPVDVTDKSVNLDISGIIGQDITAITTDEIDALFA